MRTRALWVLCVGWVLFASVAASAFRVGPSSFHLEQAPGTEEAYALVITDDTDRTEEVRLYLGDWMRAPNGEHDWASHSTAPVGPSPERSPPGRRFSFAMRSGSPPAAT